MIKAFKTHTALVVIASLTGCGALWGVIHAVDSARDQAGKQVQRVILR